MVGKQAPQLRILDSVLVAPSASAPETASLPLTFFDVFWLNSKPVESVYLYRLTNKHDTTTILSNLRASLPRALGVFYPLAGRLRLTPGTNDRYELHYQRQRGDGVTFAVAEYDCDVDELAADEPRVLAKLFPLVPTLPDGGAVLAVQVTLLRGGLAVGFVHHHAAGDGTTGMGFIHTWAAEGAGAGAGAGAPPPPVMDRSLIQDPSGMYDVFVKPMEITNKRESVTMADDQGQLLATFTLSPQDIQRVKDVVMLASARRCSSLVAAISIVWSCHQRAKEDTAHGGGGGGGDTYILVPVDNRSLMKPHPIPDGYFGNCTGPAMHAAPKDQLAMAGAGGLLAAYTAVAAAIDQAVTSGAPERWMEMIASAVASGGGLLTVAGSPRLRLYDVDHGFGRPAKVELVSVASTGAISVAESRRSRGGIEVGISLPHHAMLSFHNCFHETISWLRRNGTTSAL